MKKKVITVLLTAVLVLGTTSGAFGASKTRCSSITLEEMLGQLHTLLNSFPCGGTDDNDQEMNPDEEQKPEEDEDQDEDQDNSGDEEERPSISAGKQQKEVIQLVNEERDEVGLHALSSNNQLNALAQMKAEDMAKNKYFSHTSPTYGSAFDMMTQYGVSYKTAGENIAKGQLTAKSVMTGWMNSQGHRQNILSGDYTQIGVGYATDSSGTPYWVQMFIG